MNSQDCSSLNDTLVSSSPLAADVYQEESALLSDAATTVSDRTIPEGKQAETASPPDSADFLPEEASKGSSSSLSTGPIAIIDGTINKGDGDDPIPPINATTTNNGMDSNDKTDEVFTIPLKKASQIRDNVWMRGVTKALKWYISFFSRSASIDEEDFAHLVPGLPFVIKYGRHKGEIRSEEAHLMIYAANLLQGTNVKVPRVYCTFESKGIQYILMEKVKGDTIASVWHKLSEAEKEKVFGQIRLALEKIRVSREDPTVSGLDGAALSDVCLPPNHEKHPKDPCSLGPFPSSLAFHQHLFKCAPKMAAYRKHLSKGLPDVKKSNFLDSRWTTESTWFTHGDLSPGNILITRSGSIAIIDWETAGWWPSYVEWDRYQRYEWFWDMKGMRPNYMIPFSEEDKKISRELRSMLVLDWEAS